MYYQGKLYKESERTTDDLPRLANPQAAANRRESISFGVALLLAFVCVLVIVAMCLWPGLAGM